jgi:4-coumarate--CoA ligase
MVTITDRIKEMIKFKGIAVAPAELEDLLLGHPQVEDCAMLGIPDEYSGEKPKAYVVSKAEVEPGQGTRKAIIEVCESVGFTYVGSVHTVDVS